MVSCYEQNIFRLTCQHFPCISDREKLMWEYLNKRFADLHGLGNLMPNQPQNNPSVIFLVFSILSLFLVITHLHLSHNFCIVSLADLFRRRPPILPILLHDLCIFCSHSCSCIVELEFVTYFITFCLIMCVKY